MRSYLPLATRLMWLAQVTAHSGLGDGTVLSTQAPVRVLIG